MLRKLPVAAAVALASLCAAFAFAAPQTVQVYDSTQIALDSYTVLKRMGVSEWRSAFRMSGYSDEQMAREALLANAAQLGADGVINLHCLGQTDRMFNSAGSYCYGNAIKLKRERPASEAGTRRP
jgi:uncharacterized protein YbjQ (UPF0145 family)